MREKVDYHGIAGDTIPVPDKTLEGVDLHPEYLSLGVSLYGFLKGQKELGFVFLVITVLVWLIRQLEGDEDLRYLNQMDDVEL